MHLDQFINYDTRGRAHVRGLPESIKHCAIGVETDHPVLDCDTVNERLLVVEKVGVWDPQLIRHSVIQSQVVGDLRVGQTLVPPRLLEVHCQGVVLEDREGGGHLVMLVQDFKDKLILRISNASVNRALEL